MRSAICADEVQSTHPVLRLLRQTDRGRAYQHLNGLKNLYSASPPRRGEGGEQVATAHKKPHPAARRGFNSGSSDVTPPFRGTEADGRRQQDGDPNLNTEASAAENDLRDEDGLRASEDDAR